jgi:glycosyltransferase involved in cell wall biosynthesis
MEAADSPARKRRVLIVLDNGMAYPSAMVRALQYRPYFEASRRWDAAFVSRRSPELNALVARTNRPHVPLFNAVVHAPVSFYAKRWHARREAQIVEEAKRSDLVHCLKIPELSLYRKLKALNGPKVVAEMNDGLWLPWFRDGAWRDLDEILTISDAVICENGYTAEYVRRFNPKVFLIPDSPQLPIFDRWRKSIHRDPRQVVIGWIGTKETAYNLFRIFEPLESLFRRHSQLSLRIVGADRSVLPPFENVRFTCLPLYDQTVMVREALAFDIGVFPLFHSESAKARGVLKAMIYMSAGAAVCAERIGELPRLIADGGNGMLASSQDEWLTKLELLVTNRSERERLGARGLDTIRENFDASVVFDQLSNALDAIISSH